MQPVISSETTGLDALAGLSTDSSKCSTRSGVEPVCIIGLFRHADRTCKQKVSVKFSGDPPSGFALSEDIRSASIHVDLATFVENLDSSLCKSEKSVLENGLRILRMGQDELKVKIDRMPSGWILKLKWGGNLTNLGKSDSKNFGFDFLNSYHVSCSDLKIYSSTDTRCIETAQYFALGLCGDVDYPIRSADGPDGLGSLDDSGFRHSPLVDRMRSEMSAILMSGRKIDELFLRELFPDSHPSSAKSALLEIAQTYRSFADAVLDLCDMVDVFVAEIDTSQISFIRWQNLSKSIHRSDGSRTFSGALFTTVQISLIGEIFDNVKYDVKHGTFKSATLDKIHSLVVLLARIVTRSEYGLASGEKSFIGATFLRPLLQKFRFDARLALDILPQDDKAHLVHHGRNNVHEPLTRLYFGHHSHMVSFVNILRAHELVKDKTWIHQIGNLGYLSQIVISVFPNRLTLQVGVGDGIHCSSKNLLMTVIDEHMTIDEFDSFFSTLLVTTI